MLSTGRKSKPSGNLTKFFKSSACVNHHKKNGNLETTDNGNIRVSVTGLNYFNGRLAGQIKGQEVDKGQMIKMVEALKTGKHEDLAITKFHRIKIMS